MTGRKVLLLATGDTLAFLGDGVGFATGSELVAALPPLGVDVRVEDVMAAPSWDTTAAAMVALARRVRAAIRDDGVDGVVLTHGTDTLEETAFLVDLLAGAAAERGALVVTGAARPLTAPSADGPGNLAAALAAAADPALRGAGVVVCAQDELHAARWVSLADAVGPAGFTSAPYPPLGRVFGGRVELALPPPPRPPAANGEQPELAVPLVTTYPGIEGEQLAALADAGARGLVLAGTGLANVPASLLTAIEEPSRWDIPVVVASRCRTPAADLAELGFGARIAGRVGAIGAHGMAPAKARYALMAALGDGGGVAAARDWFAAWARG